MSVLEVTNLTFSFGNKIILEDANFVMQKGEHIGLVGMNGEGKSTFIKLITHQITPDEGKIVWAKNLTTGYLDQYLTLESGKTIKQVLEEAFKELFNKEQKMYALYDKLALDDTNSEAILEEIGEIQTLLEQSDFYNLDAKITDVAYGLGLKEVGLDKDVSMLSGGQRSKVLLTKLLLEEPTILILDEPTNFLDENQIAWLRDYLLNYSNAFILVSHDRAFMNEVINVVYHIEDATLTRYKGNLDGFDEMYNIKRRNQNQAYEKQQKEIQKLETFIAKNKARVATTNLAKSKQRILDKMEIIDKAKELVKPTFIFKKGNSSGKFVFNLENVVIGYDHPLSHPLTFSILRGEKVLIKGVNGIGKSTLLKTMLTLIPNIEGKVEKDYNLEFGYFDQEHDFPYVSAIDFVWQYYPDLTNKEVRGLLAGVGINKDKAESLMPVLSGGEKARIMLQILGNKETNTLILDEPTNHLDKLAKEALKEALLNYKGTIILVCHENEFYEGLVDRIINLEEYSTKIV